MKSLFCICVVTLFMISGHSASDVVSYRAGSPLLINCTLGGDVKWSKNGTEIQAKDGQIEIIKEDSISILKYNKAKEHEFGTYQCQSTTGESQSIDVKMEPYVAKMQPSANIVEGETFRLPCEFFGYPVPSVQWRRGEGEAEREVVVDEHIMLEANADGVENAILSFKNISAEYRDHYSCFATNDYGVANRTILVRVIDKYAALWPFLGICAEVLVLVTIIFIYEKRRSKNTFDEADDQPATDGKSSSNAKDSEVRHRK